MSLQPRVKKLPILSQATRYFEYSESTQQYPYAMRDMVTSHMLQWKTWTYQQFYDESSTAGL